MSSLQASLKVDDIMGEETVADMDEPVLALVSEDDPDLCIHHM